MTADVAARIRAMRKDRGWSQQRLADEMGTTREVIAKLETGRRASITVDELRAAAAVFDVSPAYLLGEALPVHLPVGTYTISGGPWRLGPSTVLIGEDRSPQ